MIAIPIITLVVLAAALAGPVMSDVEQARYSVVRSLTSHIEIRRYDPAIVAETTIEGERKEAISKGFRLLADYIFGNNTTQQNIAMTAPVQQKSEKIAMTAPVRQRAGDNRQWHVTFVMPAEYSMQTLPKPNNTRVTLKSVPSKTFAALTFSGTHSNANIAEHEQALTRYLTDHQIQTIGTPQYAFYNPPWTLPFLRRNEIMVEIPSQDATPDKEKTTP